MNIADFVEWEKQKFRNECNFTDEELLFFEIRSKGKSLVEIQFKMNEAGMPCSESKINKLSKSVKRKILKVL